MSDQVADVLDDAADLLEREGWTQLDFSHGSKRCAVGACLDVLTPQTEEFCSPAIRALYPLIGTDDVVGWNDDPARTKQQVLDTFRAAAKAERMHPETPAPPRTPERDGAGVGLAGGDAETRTRPADESHPPR
jgi:hypothetical protein